MTIADAAQSAPRTFRMPDFTSLGQLHSHFFANGCARAVSIENIIVLDAQMCKFVSRIDMSEAQSSAFHDASAMRKRS